MTQPTPNLRFRLEATALLLLACLFLTVGHYNAWFAAADRLLYDTIISRINAPRDPNIVIVSIDDAALHEHGAWPWPRELQARLWRQIQSHNPEKVVVDVVLAGRRQGDASLVSAAQQIESLALPIMIESLGAGQQYIELLPFPNMLREADYLGHVHVQLDADAIVRGTWLYQGIGNARWPHLMLALADPDALPSDTCAAQGATQNRHVAKCDYVRLPFAGPAETYPWVPANLLLATHSPSNKDQLNRALHNKTVIVGLTASGAGDWVTSPTSGEGAPMPGVEFNANLLSALRYQTLITQPSNALLLAIALFVVCVCSLVLPRLQSKQMLFASGALAIAPVVTTIAGLSLTSTHLPLAGASITVLLLYPLWSWRRHEIAWQFVQTELARIDDENNAWQEAGLWSREHGVEHWDQLQLRLAQLMDTTPDALNLEHLDVTSRVNTAKSALLRDSVIAYQVARKTSAKLPGEVLAAQIRMLQERAEEVREGRTLGLTGLSHAANGTLIVSALGHVVFVNPAANRLLQSNISDTPAQRTPLSPPRDVLVTLAPLAPPLGERWLDIWRRVVLEKEEVTFEATAPDQTPVYVAAQPLALEDSSSPYATHWVLTLADLAPIRTAQAQREEALAFLSHDIRSPLVSVLALIKNSPQSSPLLEDIARYTQKGLSTSEQFLQLSRLQMQSRFERYELELGQVLANAIEQVYFIAQDKQIAVTLTQQPSLETEEGVWIEGNGELLERAFENLLSNAIKYSPTSAPIEVSLRVTQRAAHIDIIDRGHGIPADEIDSIFEPYFRSAEPDLAENRGAGLGLRFVKTVIDRHDGKIRVTSERGRGTTFRIELPVAPPED